VDAHHLPVSVAELSSIMTALETRAVEGGMKGKASSIERAWLLKKGHDDDQIF